MMRSFPALVALVFVGCGGSEPAAESPASAAAPAADAPSSEPAAAPAAKGDEGGWEGEDEAKKSGGDGAGDASAGGGKPAPPDTKKEETRTAEVIAKVVKDSRQRFRDCYDKAQKELPTLKGDMVLTFTLDPEGKVKKVELNQQTSTLKSPAVVDCSIKVMQSLNFPPSSRGMETVANYPFNFNPK